MKNKIKIIIASVLVLLVCAIVFQQLSITRLRKDRNRYRSNTEVLLTDVERYKTNDSMNGARVGVLELKLAEYQRYRAADARLIDKLQKKNRDLNSVTTQQSQTIIDLQGRLKDSLVVTDTAGRLEPIPGVDTVQTLHISDYWFTLCGLIDKDGNFTGRLVNRDSLLVMETVKYKRFLGFLWKTKRIKDRRLDVISRNPHTQIMGVEHIIIEK